MFLLPVSAENHHSPTSSSPTKIMVNHNKLRDMFKKVRIKSVQPQQENDGNDSADSLKAASSAISETAKEVLTSCHITVLSYVKCCLRLYILGYTNA